MKKIHYFWHKTNWVGYTWSVCDVLFMHGDKKFITKNRKQVTCGNCKRTKLFREVG